MKIQRNISIARSGWALLAPVNFCEIICDTIKGVQGVRERWSNKFGPDVNSRDDYDFSKPIACFPNLFPLVECKIRRIQVVVQEFPTIERMYS
jgi:hypothetical protein